MEIAIVCMFFIGIALLAVALNEVNNTCMFYGVVIGIGLLFAAAVSSKAYGECNGKNCPFHHENVGKSKRTLMTRHCQKMAETHQKFLDVAKDDPDFKIYFESAD